MDFSKEMSPIYQSTPSHITQDRSLKN